MSNFNWTDNPTVSQISTYDPDVLNECLMHLKYSNIPALTTSFCFNSGNKNSNGYADLIEATLSTNKVFSQPGTYSITIPTSGNYDVVAVGGGAGGAWGMDVYAVRSSASGGSGAAFVGNIYIPAGTYTCTVGSGGSAAGNGGTGGAGGNTTIGNIVSAGGGAAGAYATWGTRTASAGGTLTINNTINSYTVKSNGNNGSTAYNGSSSGGASLCNGYGAGGSATTSSSSAGVSGYLSIKLSTATYINYKIGGTYPKLIGTLASGEQFTVSGLNSDDSTSLADGTYNKFVGADGSSELLKNTIYKQSHTPAPALNDVWYNTSVEPCTAQKYNGSDWETYDKIPLASLTISNGTVTSYCSYEYNQNGYNTTLRSPLGKPSARYETLTVGATGTTYSAPANGWFAIYGYGNSANTACIVSLVNVNNGLRSSAFVYSTVSNGCALPVRKGDIVQLYYTRFSFDSTGNYFKFYYDEGAY